MLRIVVYNKITGKKVDLKELEKFGFKLNEDSNYEFKEYYPLEDDGTRYIDDNDFDYIWSIEIYERKDGNELWLEVINNDCTYHNEGDEVEGIMNLIYDLIQAGYLEKVEEE